MASKTKSTTSANFVAVQVDHHDHDDDHHDDDHRTTFSQDDAHLDALIDRAESGGSYIGAPSTPYGAKNKSPSGRPSRNSLINTMPLSFSEVHPHLRECLAEFLGTYVMICFGFGVNNQVMLSNNTHGTWMSINVCWGIAVMLGVHCSEGVSGAHLNPAVTFGMAVYNRLAWRKVPGYVLAQLIGCFAGALTIYVLYLPVINDVDPDRMTTHHHFATYPHVPNATAFYTEFLATAFLMLGVFAITDKKNRPAHATGAPVSFALLIMAIGMAFGMNTGYAINPARDFAPRCFTYLVGYGSRVFTLNDYYFWIPMVAPLVGAVFGGGLYRVCVENLHPLRTGQV